MFHFLFVTLRDGSLIFLEEGGGGGGGRRYETHSMFYIVHTVGYSPPLNPCIRIINELIN